VYLSHPVPPMRAPGRRIWSPDTNSRRPQPNPDPTMLFGHQNPGQREKARPETGASVRGPCRLSQKGRRFSEQSERVFSTAHQGRLNLVVRRWMPIIQRPSKRGRRPVATIFHCAMTKGLL
jgi:hypothetical protein